MFQYSFHTRNGKTRYRGLLKHRMHAYSRCMWMNLRRMVIFQISTFQRSIFALFRAYQRSFRLFQGDFSKDIHQRSRLLCFTQNDHTGHAGFKICPFLKWASMFKIKSKKMAVHKKYNNGTKSNALGRGLDALISTEGVRTQGSSTINEIPLDQIEANPNQPRREFDDEALHELAESIKAIGIIQPITLRQVSENRFQIIAGERRWRAFTTCGADSYPCTHPHHQR